MHELVGIAAQGEVVLGPQGFQDQADLDVRQVLHFVHDHEVVPRPEQAERGVGRQVGVVKAVAVEELQVLQEDVVDAGAFLVE